MNKDVIYIDVEDDITAIIEKIKASKEKIVALVPPKRIGVLQSAVNLRLLSRASSSADKRVVIITGNAALGSLAAAAGIPVAKNLQSKPEMAEIAALQVDDEDDIIDGTQLPVSEFDDAAKKADDDPSDGAVESIAAAETAPKPTKADKKASKTKKDGKKVPNFNKFRKKLILIIAAAVLLIVGLIWAIFFAPAATVIISANTTNMTVNDVVRLADENSLDDGTIKSTTETIERQASVEFEATGEKEVGEYASGTVRFSTNNISALGESIPAGTVLTSESGSKYETTASATMSLDNASGVSVGIRATERGTDSNGASGSVDGAPNGVSARITDATSGGTDRTVSVVTSGDVQKASEKLVDQSNDDMEKELRERFGDDYIVIDGSFTVDRAAASSSPAVGEEADKATLTSNVTYSLSGIAQEDADDYLTTSLENQIEGDDTQRVYSTGSDDITFSEYNDEGDVPTVRISAEGAIGPSINEDELKEQVAGKRLGEIQSDLESREGVTSVDVRFSFFWVRTIPENTDKISIEFDLSDEETE